MLIWTSNALCEAGNEVRLILAPGAHNQSKPIPTLVRAVAQGRLGTSGSLSERSLAKRIVFNEDYVSRILDLAVFSPEMTEAIFGAHRYTSLTVAQLIGYTRVLRV